MSSSPDRPSQPTGVSSQLPSFLGLSILKVIPGGKSPATKRGVYDAQLVDEESLEALQNEFGRTLLNGGVRLGEGIVVLDTDPRNDGDLTLNWLLKAFGRLPDTWIVDTASGGTHHYFKAPAGFKKTTLGAGLDVLGAGHYCLIPGSVVKGVLYQFREGYGPEDIKLEELPDLPDWIAEYESESAGWSSAILKPSQSLSHHSVSTQNSSQEFGGLGGGSEGEADEVSAGFVLNLLFGIPADLPRDHWIKVGMALSALEDGVGDVTLDDDSLTLDCERLWHLWSAGHLADTVSSKYNFRDADVQWKSFKRRPSGNRGFVSFRSLVYISQEYVLEGEFHWESPTIIESTMESGQKKTADRMGATQPLHPTPLRKGTDSNMINPLAGQVEKIPLPESDNFKLVYREVVRLMNFHSHELAMAVTRQIFVTCCGMRGITASGRRLMFNPVLVGKPRTGKSTALSVFKDIMHAALPGYTCGWPDSAQGMQKTLKDKPNVCMIGEEHGNIALAGVTARSNEWQKKFHGFMLNLIAGATSLDEQIVKKDGVAAVSRIYVTSILNTTEDLLREAFCNGASSNRGDGITRRFTLFYSEKPKATRRLKAIATKEVSKDVIDLLLKLSGSQKFIGSETASPPPPYNDIVMSLSQDADSLIDQFCDQANANIDQAPDDSLVSLMLETLDKIEDHACLLAYIDGRPEVSVQDVLTSYTWSQIEFRKMVDLLETSEEYQMLKLIDHMVNSYEQGKEVSKRQMTIDSRSVRSLLKYVEDKGFTETVMTLFEHRTGAVNLAQSKLGHQPSAAKFRYLKSAPKRIK